METLIAIALLALGYTAGTIAEKKHFRSIAQREKQTIAQPLVSMENVFDPQSVSRSTLVVGSVVISIDYFKRFLAALRNLFGGTVSSYESLLDRARREALLRMKAMAPDADMIINVRIETSSIGQSANQRSSVGSIEAVAYGTAIWQKV